MRSTVDILDSLDQELRKKAKRLGLSFKEALNQTIAAGLSVLDSKDKKNNSRKKVYRVRAKDCGFREGVDVTRLNSLVDELEDEAQGLS